MTLDDIKKLYKQGSFRDLDYFLTETLDRRYQEVTPEALLTTALASHNLVGNHVCLDLNAVAGTVWPKKNSGDEEVSFRITLPNKDEWIEILKASPICGSGNDNGSTSPLVLVDSRVYLRRYFSYEKSVAEKLLDLAEPTTLDNQKEQILPDEDQDKLLPILFPDDGTGSNANQIEAAKVILKNRLLIISGGPGTGKTYTLARLTALLVAASGDDSPIIRMAAPTGKAAMRMRESIRNAKNDIKTALEKDQSKSKIIKSLQEKIADIPENTCTLHRLLGTIPNSTKFRHNAENPLPADIIIIDEASMIDLPMMAKILSAMQENTKLILLGDMHQLSSVEPGSVMGDICQAAHVKPDSCLGKSLVKLTFSHRFGINSPVGELSTALLSAGSDRDPDGQKAWDALKTISLQKDSGDCVLLHETPESLSNDKNRPIDDFREAVWENYKDLLNAETVKDAFEAINKFRVFSPMHKGPHGLLTINRLIEDTLAHKNIKNSAKDVRPLNTVGEFYNHRIVMIKCNNYGLKLFNGDIGIVMNEDANGATENMSVPPKKVIWFENAKTEKSEGELELEELTLDETETANLPEKETETEQ